MIRDIGKRARHVFSSQKAGASSFKKNISESDSERTQVPSQQIQIQEKVDTIVSRYIGKPEEHKLLRNALLSPIEHYFLQNQNFESAKLSDHLIDKSYNYIHNILDSSYASLDEKTKAAILASVKDLVIHSKNTGQDASEPSVAARELFGTMKRAGEFKNKTSLLELNNQVLPTVLHGGDEIWSAAETMIENARSHVQLQTWAYYKNSASSQSIMRGLLKAYQKHAERYQQDPNQKPMQVHIQIGYSHGDFGDSELTGGKASQTKYASKEFFYKIFPFPIDPNIMQVDVSRPKSIWARGAEHSKTLVIDNNIGLITSANVKGNHNKSHSDDRPFHDFGFVMKGDIVQKQILREAENRRQEYKVIASNKDEKSEYDHEIMQETILRLLNPKNYAPLFRDDYRQIISSEKNNLLESFISNKSSSTFHNVSFLSLPKERKDVLYAHKVDSPQNRILLASINNAKKSIEINHANTNAKEIIQALEKALLRGVSVRIMSSERYNDLIFKYNRTTNKNIYDRLQRFKERHQAPGDLQLKWFPLAKNDLRYKNSHTKAMFIDENVAILGSANLDNQSLKYSGEINVATHDPKTVRMLRESLFESFWKTAYLTSPPLSKQEKLNLKFKRAIERVKNALNEPQKPMAQIVDQQFKKALKSTDIEEKNAYMSNFNQQVSPYLSYEEAALGHLAMKNIRLQFSPDIPIEFNIQQNIENDIQQDYDARYYISSSFIDSQTGIRAYGLTPENIDKRNLLIFEGVNWNQDLLRRREKYPTGKRAAADRQGLGARSFDTNKDKLVDMARFLGPKTTMVGYSLGGVLAAKLYQEVLQKDENTGKNSYSKNTHLMTFNAPGIDKKTADKLFQTGVYENMKHFRMRLDPLSQVGENRIPGLTYKLPARFPSYFKFWKILGNHTTPYLSNQSINNAYNIDETYLIQALEPSQAASHSLSPSVDKLRRLWFIFKPPI